jgi:hypothetical protein
MDILGKRRFRPFLDFSVGKYKVIMYKLIGNVYTEIDRTEIKVENSQFRYKPKFGKYHKDFVKIDTKLIAFRDSKFNYYAFDFDTGDQIYYQTKEFPKGKITLDEIDVYVNGGIIKQIVAGLEKVKAESKTGLIIIVGIMGGAIGFIIAWLIATNINVRPAFTFLLNILGVL